MGERGRALSGGVVEPKMGGMLLRLVDWVGWLVLLPFRLVGWTVAVIGRALGLVVGFGLMVVGGGAVGGESDGLGDSGVSGGVIADDASVGVRFFLGGRPGGR
ncbi:MAG: hypothetical protein KatS3mg108_0223 [Isosphaeraceae bacterium]|nr:MAG: hypothetical protein KatS3mg108_0223 [Isosphaeraceae bacterium]